MSLVMANHSRVPLRGGMMSESSSSSDQHSRGKVAAHLTQLGKYRISRKLGVGGMGTVYLATDTDLKRDVALKVLPRDRAENPTLVRRFKAEGHAAALLKHPNIVSVYEAGQADGYLFLALEYIDGMDLLEWMHRRGALSVRQSIDVVKQVALALQHASDRNIVHRDIKPSNLMISSQGIIKLTDMGLARSIDDTLDSTITRDGTTVGTVDYMAPEQAANSRSADIRSDIYSLGCTWYHMLTGVAPYPDGSVTNKLSAHASNPVPDPRRLNPRIPEAVVAVIHRMMAKTKEARYQTPKQLLADLNNDTLTRSGQPTDLLAAFGDDEDLQAALAHAARRDFDSSAVFDFEEGSGGAETPSRGSVIGAGAAGLPPRRSAAATRAELDSTESRNQRQMLTRGGGKQGDKPATVVPWKFLLLIGLLGLLALLGWIFLG